MSGRAATINVIPGRCALSVGKPDLPAPPGWMWVALGEIAQLESGHTPSRQHPEYWDGDIPWIGLQDAREHHGGVIHTTRQHVTPLGIANSAARVLPAGTVCLSRTASVGYVVVTGREMATSQDFVNWVCSEALLPEFLQFLFLAEQESLPQFSKGTTHSTIYFPEVKAFHVCLPPVGEQRRIVDQVTASRERSARARLALESLQPFIGNLRQSILATAFCGDLTADWREKNPDVEPASVLLDRIRKERRQKWEESELAKMQVRGKTPTDDRWKKYVEPEPTYGTGLPELPQTWCWAALEEVAILKGGITKDEKRDVAPATIRVPYLRVANVQRGHLDLTNVKEIAATAEEIQELSLRPGDILLNEGGDRDKLGRGWIWEGQLPLCLHQNHVFRARPVSALLHSRLISHYTNEFGQRFFIEEGKQTTNLASISMRKISRVPLPIIPPEEAAVLLDRISQAFTRVSQIEQAVSASLIRLDALQSAVLAKAFRGELVTQDPNDEPASVLLERIRAKRAAAEEEPKRRHHKKGRSRDTPSEPRAAVTAEWTAPSVRIPKHATTPPALRIAFDEHSLEDLLAATRRVLGTGNRDRATLIRDVARDLGFARTGSSIHAAIVGAINTASRRLITRSKGGLLSLYSPSIEDYGKDELKQLFLAAIGTTWWERDEAIRAAARYLGFKRTGERIDTLLRSVINGLIRQGRLQRQGTRIRRV